MKPFHESLRYEYDLTPMSIVIDAGAHKGDFTAEIVRRYDCHVICFEPIKEFYQEVCARFADNPKVRVNNAALGSANVTARMWIKGCMSGRFAAGEKFEDVRVIDAVEEVKMCPSWERTPVDLIKINIEGGEFELLPRLITGGIITHFKNIQVQFHSVIENAQDLYEHIRERLLQTHELTFDAPWCWENYRLK